MTDFHSIIFSNLWLIAILVGVINSLIIRIRISSIVKQHPELRQEGNRFSLGYLLAITLPWLVLGILQNLGGFSNISYIYLNDLTNQYVILARASIILFILLYTYWIVLRDGAKTLIKFKCVRGNPNEKIIKFTTLVSATVSIIILLVTPRSF